MSRDDGRFQIRATMKSRMVGTKQKRVESLKETNHEDIVKWINNGKIAEIHSRRWYEEERCETSIIIIKLSASGSTKAVDIHI